MSDLSTRHSAKAFKGWRGVGENLLVVALASLGPTPSFDEGGFGHGRRRAYAVDEVPVVRVIVHARRPQPVAGSPYPLGCLPQVVHGLVEDRFFVRHGSILFPSPLAPPSENRRFASS